MKQLALIHIYHQTHERLKPPVEQRVKVMDTLDKKMQTMLERENLSQAIRPIVHSIPDTQETGDWLRGQ